MLKARFFRSWSSASPQRRSESFVLYLFLLVLAASCGPPNDRSPGDRSPGDNASRSPSAESAAASKSVLPPPSKFERPKASPSSTEDLSDDSTVADLQRLLLQDPKNPELLFRYARRLQANGRTDLAISVLEPLSQTSGPVAIAAAGQAGDWILRGLQSDVERGRLDHQRHGDRQQFVSRLQNAVQWYEKIAVVLPDEPTVHRRLATLKNYLGQTRQSARHLDRLLTVGDLHQQELANLADRDGVGPAIGIPGVLSNAIASQLISPVYRSRLRWIEGDYQQCFQILQKCLRNRSNTRPISSTTTLTTSNTSSAGWKASDIAFYGRAALETQDQAELSRWWAFIRDRRDLRSEPDVWFVVGSVLLQSDLNQTELAARCFARVIRDDPTDAAAYAKLETAADRLGLSDQMLQFRNGAALIRRCIRISNRVTGQPETQPRDYSVLIQSLRALHRNAEAAYWKLIAANADANSDPAAMNRLVTAMNQTTSGYETPSVTSSNEFFDAIGWQLDQPTFEQMTPLLNEIFGDVTSDKVLDGTLANHRLSLPTPSTARPFRLTEVSDEVGLDFQYLNGSRGRKRDFQIYEQMGAGFALADYNQDGHLDAFMVQCGVDPVRSTERHQPSGSVDLSHVLYHGDGSRFRPTPIHHHPTDYVIGAASGDVNQDGFSDVLLNCVGPNRLLINQGDGTFDDTTMLPSPDPDGDFTCSSAIADLDDDGLPDLFEVNYIDDPAAFLRGPEDSRGRLIQVRGPESYQPARDSVWIMRPDGHLQPDRSLDGAEPRYGLGVLVTDFDHQPGNEVFVANDTRGNQLWRHTRRVDHSTSVDDPPWSDVASAIGLSHSFAGGSGASRGVASGDFDGDGDIDLHVTNFLNEVSHVYMSQSTMHYQDRVNAMGLYRPTLDQLGFGTTAADFDNNGTLDLAITNGHIDDLGDELTPMKMQPQIFQGFGSHFEPVAAGDYWNGHYVGRTIAHWDYDNDGKVDLLVGHLDRPAAVLHNETHHPHHWLTVSLVGTRCERDAIGARVTVTTGTGDRRRWVTAGDGFAVSADRRLHFGLGTDDRVTDLVVDWPDGRQSRHGPQVVDRAVLIIQE